MKYLISILLLGFVIGCSDNKKIPLEQFLFLEKMGYRVISYEGRSGSYELTKQKITTLPYSVYWGLQPVDPSNYFGKTINVEKFIVKNHPLNEGKVDVYVYEADGQPIGGTSHPHNDPTDGGYWSIEGKTLEELHNKPFQEWQKEWLNKFRD